MPAYTRTPDALGVKLVSVFHANHKVGLPGHQAVILLFDPENGSPIALMDGRYITEARTAAVSAVSARLLARPGARTVGILGSGVQAHAHVEALSHVLPGLQYRAWSPNRANLERFAADCGVAMAASADEAVRDADLIVTVTNCTTPVLFADWVRPGAHIMAVGACRAAHREVDPKLVAASKVYVDSRASALREAGDILIDHLEHTIVGELGELIAGRIAGRTSSDEITLFKSLGLAVEDVVAAHRVYTRSSH